MIRNFINLADFSPEQLSGLLDRAVADKASYKQGKLPASLERKTLAMIFEKPSLRTRASFEIAMTQLGGHAMYLTDADMGIGKREPVKDVARVLGRMCDGIVARTFSHDMVVQLARHAGVPVINALTDYSHPCQAMADAMTVLEHFGELPGRKIAFVGDGNNVALSMAVACSKLGMKFAIACPPGHALNEELVRQLGDAVTITDDPETAVAGSDVVYTDTWVSMGQEEQKEQRIREFRGFQVDSDLLAAAAPGAIVLHCLPAYRGYEITNDVFEAHAESIFAESENRLHFQRTLLDVLMTEGGIR